MGQVYSKGSFSCTTHWQIAYSDAFFNMMGFINLIIIEAISTGDYKSVNPGKRKQEKSHAIGVS